MRTTMSPPETSADGLVVGSGVGSDDVSHWEKILASFIAQSSATLAHPYFYLIRTNTKWSLCLLSGLSPTIFSALLLECELVSICTNRKLLERTSNLDKDVIINKVCDNVGLAFKLWDGVFSAIHSPSPTADC